MQQHQQKLDPHQRPPEPIRQVYKKYQKMQPSHLSLDADIIDLPSEPTALLPPKVRIIKELDRANLASAFQTFFKENPDGQNPSHGTTPLYVYAHDDLPGLHIIPSLLPPDIQSCLLSRLLHRDLSNPAHLTNIHTHYNISYPPESSSFFSLSPSSSQTITTPFDPAVHRPLTVTQLLNKKMRWATLGGQYDWTEKHYPDATPPDFPADIKRLLESLFTDTKAEAAIVNLYSPGDTLSVHRDVAESSATGLVSISLGCDAIFVIGTSDSSALNGDESITKVLTVRLRSGSAVYMSGESRFAWHGVPQIVPQTCPDHLKDWPGGPHDAEGVYTEWTGWMAKKRVNLNVRQMWDD